MAGIKLQIDLPKPEKDNRQVSALVSELKAVRSEIRALKGSPSKTIIENKVIVDGNKNPLKPKEKIRVVKVKDKVSDKKISRLQKELGKVKTQLKKKVKPKVIVKTIVKKQVIKEKSPARANDTNLVKHLKALQDSMPTTSHIGGNV